MAVDFAVPLITNVKVAKLLFEALVRRLPLEVSPVDFKTSHETHTFPSLINIAAFIPGLTSVTSDDFVESMKASVSGGFATTIILPIGDNSRLEDETSLDQARANLAKVAHCNFAMGITASSTNAKVIDEELEASVKALFIPFSRNKLDLGISDIATHFASWPADKPIVTNAKGTDLAPVLLFADLHGRNVHVTDVQSKDDLLLISLSKAKQLKVTCDVAIHSLFFTREQFPGSTCLPSEEDQKAIWTSLETIDAFSVGNVPYVLARELNEDASPWSGVEEALPLLLNAVAEGRLTLKDIQTRLHDNPVRIFSLPDQVHTNVEVVIGRRAHISAGTRKHKCWSPLAGKLLDGAVHRVLVHGQTAFLDGVVSQIPVGRDLSSATISHIIERSHSFSGQRPDVGAFLSQAPRAPEPLTHSSSGVQLAVPSGAMTSVYGPIPAPLQLSHFAPHPAFHRHHILSVKQFSHRDVHELFQRAQEMQLQVERNGILDVLRGKVIATVFYEPSTRTCSSFDAAMKRCGGEVVNVNVDSSSVLKGETLPDTIRTLGCYADAIVIRHPDVGSSQLAAKYSPVPIINAGDGIGEHPTQVCHIFLRLIASLTCILGLTGCFHYSIRAWNCQRANNHTSWRPQERSNSSQFGYPPMHVLRSSQLRCSRLPRNAGQCCLCST